MLHRQSALKIALYGAIAIAYVSDCLWLAEHYIEWTKFFPIVEHNPYSVLEVGVDFSTTFAAVKVFILFVHCVFVSMKYYF